MSWNFVLSKIKQYIGPPLIAGGGDIATPTAEFYAEFLGYLYSLYTKSPHAKTIIDEIVAQNDITVAMTGLSDQTGFFAPPDFFGPGLPPLVAFDFKLDEKLRNFNKFGNTVSSVRELLVIHELIHFWKRKSDPQGDTAAQNGENYDFDGFQVTETNKVAVELGHPDLQRASYGASFLNDHTDRSNKILENSSYTSGSSVDIVRVGLIIGDNFDNSARKDNSRDLLIGLGGSDLLSGGGGDDYIYGGEGDDTLAGGTGTNFIDGGEGEDVYDISYEFVHGGTEFAGSLTLDLGAAGPDNRGKIEVLATFSKSAGAQIAATALVDVENVMLGFGGDTVNVSSDIMAMLDHSLTVDMGEYLVTKGSFDTVTFSSSGDYGVFWYDGEMHQTGLGSSALFYGTYGLLSVGNLVGSLSLMAIRAAFGAESSLPDANLRNSGDTIPIRLPTIFLLFPPHGQTIAYRYPRCSAPYHAARQSPVADLFFG